MSARKVRQPGALRRRLLARRTSEQPRSYRIANSIRLPWAAGVASFLLISLFGGLIVGRSDDTPTDVPPVVLDYQEALTVEIAQSIRRSVNEGSNDVRVLAGSLGVAIDAGAPRDGAEAEALFRGFSAIHGRYRALALLDDGGNRLLEVGGTLHTEERVRDLPVQDSAVSKVVAAQDDALVIALTSPVPGTDLTVWAEYDPAFLRFSLETARPGEAWVLDDEGRVIATATGADSLTELPRRTLREQADKAVGGASGVSVLGGSFEELEVVGYSPVSGSGPTGAMGWSVVTTRTVRSLPTPGTSARRQAVLFALLLAIMTATIFGWLLIVVIRPIIQVQQEAERIAFGDLAKPVKVERYDEIGLLGRALERTRVLLIRRRGGRPRGPSDPDRSRAGDGSTGGEG